MAKTVSSQVRRRNTFCRIWMVSRTAHELGYGPKYCPRLLVAPR
ncbi:Uncharacterised protein [Bordetella pertussis]|nr:Uncharacterised protein [Bordetella pertussis]CFW34691.1 Uncharacterised protein [Bordetella pertussis]